MFRKLNVYVSVIAFGLLSGLANAVTLEDVSFSSLPGERLEVTLQFDGAPPEPSGYTIERPARIAVDLRDTTSGLDSRSVPLGSGNAQSMTVVETKDRTRLIFNLVELVPYDTVRSGNSLIMTIGGQSEGVVASASTSSSQSSGTTNAAPSNTLAGVDFRRGKDGEGRVLVDLGSSSTPVDLTERSGKIRLTMNGIAVPADLRRRLHHRRRGCSPGPFPGHGQRLADHGSGWRDCRQPPGGPGLYKARVLLAKAIGRGL